MAKKPRKPKPPRVSRIAVPDVPIPAPFGMPPGAVGEMPPNDFLQKLAEYKDSAFAMMEKQQQAYVGETQLSVALRVLEMASHNETLWLAFEEEGLV